MTKDLEKIWKELSNGLKQKIIEKINERSEYQWESTFWPKMIFKNIPPVLKEELKKELRKL